MEAFFIGQKKVTMSYDIIYCHKTCKLPSRQDHKNVMLFLIRC